MSGSILGWIGGGLLALGASSTVQAHHLVRQISLPGDGSWDYVIVADDARRVLATHGTVVDVLDADTLKPIGVQDTPGPHTALVVGGKVVVTAGGSNQVLVFDLKTLARVASIPVAAGSDAMSYEPKTGRAFAFAGKARAVSVVDPVQSKVLATIPLDAKPEFAVKQTVATAKGARTLGLDPRTHRILLPVADRAASATGAGAGARAPLVPGTFRLLVVEP